MLIIIYEDIFGDQHREVVHDQTCKNLLYHAVLFLRMKSREIFSAIPYLDQTDKSDSDFQFPRTEESLIFAEQ